jgi:hypothetical protein
MKDQYIELFGCDLGQYPFRYLGIPMHNKRISNADWKIIEEKIELLERKSVVTQGHISINKLHFE